MYSGNAWQIQYFYSLVEWIKNVHWNLYRGTFVPSGNECRRVQFWKGKLVSKVSIDCPQYTPLRLIHTWYDKYCKQWSWADVVKVGEVFIDFYWKAKCQRAIGKIKDEKEEIGNSTENISNNEDRTGPSNKGECNPHSNEHPQLKHIQFDLIFHNHSIYSYFQICLPICQLFLLSRNRHHMLLHIRILLGWYIVWVHMQIIFHVAWEKYINRRKVLPHMNHIASYIHLSIAPYSAVVARPATIQDIKQFAFHAINEFRKKNKDIQNGYKSSSNKKKKEYTFSWRKSNDSRYL